MTDHKDNPAEIFLVPMLGDEHDHIWSEDPAPGEGMREEDATRYVREDLVPESNAVLANSIAELTRKNSELAAQINNIHKIATEAHEALGFLSHHLRGRMGEAALMDMAEKSDALKEALAATPEQCLAEVKAQAVEDFYKALMRSPNISITGKEIISGIWLCCPARELSQAAKGGE